MYNPLKKNVIPYMYKQSLHMNLVALTGSIGPVKWEAEKEVEWKREA